MVPPNAPRRNDTFATLTSRDGNRTNEKYKRLRSGTRLYTWFLDGWGHQFCYTLYCTDNRAIRVFSKAGTPCCVRAMRECVGVGVTTSYSMQHTRTYV